MRSSPARQTPASSHTASATISPVRWFSFSANHEAARQPRTTRQERRSPGSTIRHGQQRHRGRAASPTAPRLAMAPTRVGGRRGRGRAVRRRLRVGHCAISSDYHGCMDGRAGHRGAPACWLAKECQSNGPDTTQRADVRRSGCPTASPRPPRSTNVRASTARLLGHVAGAADRHRASLLGRDRHGVRPPAWAVTTLTDLLQSMTALEPTRRRGRRAHRGSSPWSKRTRGRRRRGRPPRSGPSNGSARSPTTVLAARWPIPVAGGSPACRRDRRGPPRHRCSRCSTTRPRVVEVAAWACGEHESGRDAVIER